MSCGKCQTPHDKEDCYEIAVTLFHFYMNISCLTVRTSDTDISTTLTRSKKMSEKGIFFSFL